MPTLLYINGNAILEAEGEPCLDVEFFLGTVEPDTSTLANLIWRFLSSCMHSIGAAEIESPDIF